MLPERHVRVFNGQGGRFPGGVFTDRALAEAWIASNRLTGDRRGDAPIIPGK